MARSAATRGLARRLGTTRDGMRFISPCASQQGFGELQIEAPDAQPGQTQRKAEDELLADLE